MFRPKVEMDPPEQADRANPECTRAPPEIDPSHPTRSRPPGKHVTHIQVDLGTFQTRPKSHEDNGRLQQRRPGPVPRKTHDPRSRPRTPLRKPGAPRNNPGKPEADLGHPKVNLDPWRNKLTPRQSKLHPGTTQSIPSRSKLKTHPPPAVGPKPTVHPSHPKLDPSARRS